MTKNSIQVLLLDDSAQYRSELREFFINHMKEYSLVDFARYDDAITFMKAAAYQDPSMKGGKSITLPALCLVDVALGAKRTGFDFVKELRSIGLDLPVVILTDNYNADYADRSADAGAVEFCSKDAFESLSTARIVMRLAMQRQTIGASHSQQNFQDMYASLLQMVGETIHDLRNVILPLQNFTQINEKRLIDIDPTCSVEFEAMKGAIQEGNYLIEVLREFASTGKVKYKPSNVDLDKLLQEVAAKTLPKGYKFSLDCRIGRVVSDPNLLRRIFSCLLRNIVDHGNGAPAEIKCWLQSEGQQKAAVIQVRDTGPGIPECLLNTMWYPGSHREKSPGKGLGLAIVKRHIELHEAGNTRGSVRYLRPEKGTGSIFHIVLPLTNDGVS